MSKNGQLGSAKQNADQQELRCCIRRLQWDGRLIALAATAENLSE